jgi:hypothetical protein
VVDVLLLLNASNSLTPLPACCPEHSTAEALEGPDWRCASYLTDEPLTAALP